MDLASAKMLGAGLACIALVGAGIGIGNVFSALITSVARNPAALQLRYLQTLSEVGKGEGSTVLLPLPLDVIGSIVRGAGDDGRGNGRRLAHAA